MPTCEQFQGCLVGQATGDALGHPLEGRSPEDCDAFVCSRLEDDPLADQSAPFRGDVGQYGSDTQLACELALSVLECRGQFSETEFARRLTAMFRAGRLTRPGDATEAAARHLADSDSETASATSSSPGNGAAARAAPIGMIYYDDLAALRQVADRQARITHADPRARAGAVAVAGAVAYALRGELGPGSEPAIGRVARLAEPVSEHFAVELEKLKAWMALPWYEAVREVSLAGIEARSADSAMRGIPPYATSSVAWALYSVLRSPDDYGKTICTAIRAGGDVDTTAAIAGAVSGTINGAASVPHQWAMRIHDSGVRRLDDLTDLGSELYELTKGTAI